MSAGPSEARRRAWLRLARSENVGPATCRALMARYGDPQKALEAIPDLARRGGARKPARICSEGQADRELAAGAAAGARLLTLEDADYPELLAQLDPPPPLIWTLGPAPPALDRRALGFVGARNASAQGRRFAAWMAEAAVAAGFTAVSGLARGIDAAAHEGALAAQAGRSDAPTAAVLAGGVDQIYPEQNAPIYHAMRERGALISEAPPGLVAAARHFPRRNRLISGLSLGVLVVEAAARSGSLITARLAAEQGREVMAVPGHPFDPRAAGVNRLLREGATLVTAIEDVLEALTPLLAHPAAPIQSRLLEPAPLAAPLDPAEPDPVARQRLLDALSAAPTGLDDLYRLTGISAADGAAALLELELAGLIEREPGGAVRRAPPDAPHVT